ncbi:hypothetical protein MUP77_02710 [Candidatus Bathyarchaeota archaeon]|nr:hypothetical protein [Candidatus Bathyarchaeota archaeon]
MRIVAQTLRSITRSAGPVLYLDGKTPDELSQLTRESKKNAEDPRESLYL